MKIKNKATRAISLLLALLMLFGALPLTVFAEGLNSYSTNTVDTLENQNNGGNSTEQLPINGTVDTNGEADNTPVGDVDLTFEPGISTFFNAAKNVP